MPSFNEITIMGHLGRDPEIRDVGEYKVCTFSVATSYGTGDNKTTEWHRVIAWDGDRVKLASRCHEYLAKGRLVYVRGRVQSRKYTDKSGTERTAYEVKAYQVLFLDRPQNQSPEKDDGDMPW